MHLYWNAYGRELWPNFFYDGTFGSIVILEIEFWNLLGLWEMKSALCGGASCIKGLQIIKLSSSRPPWLKRQLLASQSQSAFAHRTWIPQCPEDVPFRDPFHLGWEWISTGRVFSYRWRVPVSPEFFLLTDFSSHIISVEGKKRHRLIRKSMTYRETWCGINMEIRSSSNTLFSMKIFSFRNLSSVSIGDPGRATGDRTWSSFPPSFPSKQRARYGEIFYKTWHWRSIVNHREIIFVNGT